MHYGITNFTSPTPMTESMENRVEVRMIYGKNRATQMVYSSPFRIFQLRQDDPADPVPLMFSNYGGGMLQGDRVRLELTCGEESALHLQSQANSQVFRNENGLDAYFELMAKIEKNSSVVISPEPVVLHKDSRYRQVQCWHLEKRAKLILVDWMQSGRSDSGEQFQFKSYRSEMEIQIEGKTLIKERFRCCPEQDNPQSYASFRGMNHMVSIFYIGYDSLPEKLKDFRKKELLKVLPLKNHSTQRFDRTHKDGSDRLLVAEMELPLKSGWVVRVLAESRLDLEPLLRIFSFGHQGVQMDHIV